MDFCSSQIPSKFCLSKYVESQALSVCLTPTYHFSSPLRYQLATNTQLWVLTAALERRQSDLFFLYFLECLTWWVKHKAFSNFSLPMAEAAVPQKGLHSDVCPVVSAATSSHQQPIKERKCVCVAPIANRLFVSSSSECAHSNSTLSLSTFVGRILLSHCLTSTRTICNCDLFV